MNRSLLIDILKVQSESRDVGAMNGFIKRYAKSLGCDVQQDHGNVYVTKGEPSPFYPTIIAHTDTVHKIIAPEHYRVHAASGIFFGWDKKRNAFSGVGGDDKVGIFLALQALSHFDSLKLAFFRDEEIGCQGSAKARMDFFDDSSFVLQSDRRGYGDFIDYIGGTQLHGVEFAEAVRPILDSYKFKPTSGGMTDVQELKDKGLKVACANMCSGYYLPHTSREYIIEGEVEAIGEMMYAIIAEHGQRQFLHESITKSYRHAWREEAWEWAQYKYRQGHKGTGADGYGYGSYTSTHKGEWRRDELSAWPTDDEDEIDLSSYIGGTREVDALADDESEDYLRWLEDSEARMGQMPCDHCGGTDQMIFDDTVDVWYCEACQDYSYSEMTAR